MIPRFFDRPFSDDGEMAQQISAQARVERRERERNRLEKRKKSFFWLARALGLPKNFDFKSMLLSMGTDGTAAFYHPPRVIRKSGSGVRVIISPKPELMLVQKRVKKLLMRIFERHPNSFGYMGGSCIEVAQRHAQSGATLKLDVRDAFFQVYRKRLRQALSENGHFSKTVAYWIALLCTYNPSPPVVKRLYPYVRTFLPQGSPTSPICYELACGRVDRKLARVAERLGGTYSRFADNYFFSMPTQEISDGVERIVVCDTERFARVHKLRTVSKGESCRVLGYNIQNGKISNSKEYRRKLRGALHVLRTRLERGLEYEAAYSRVIGLVGFTVNLPTDLQATYSHCLSLIRESEGLK